MGVHSGTAVQRDGDWYGATVNVAARLADAAAAGEILMSLTTRDRIARGRRDVRRSRRAQLQERRRRRWRAPWARAAARPPALGRGLAGPAKRKGATGKRRPFFR